MLFVRGFMLTEADGTSPVEWLDPAWSEAWSCFWRGGHHVWWAYGGALVHGASNPELARLQTVMGTTGNGGLQSRRMVPPNWVEPEVSHTQNTGYRDQEATTVFTFELTMPGATTTSSITIGWPSRR